MELNLNNENATIKIKSNLSRFVFCEDEEKEFTQIITIKGNGKLEFESYNFRYELKRKEEKNLNINSVKLIYDIKNILEKQEICCIAKDAGNWEIEITDNDNLLKYFGMFDGESDYILYDDMSISNYLKSIIDIQNLILLDNNRGV